MHGIHAPFQLAKRVDTHFLPSSVLSQFNSPNGPPPPLPLQLSPKEEEGLLLPSEQAQYSHSQPFVRFKVQISSIAMVSEREIQIPSFAPIFIPSQQIS
jgi:hypothetical protein